MIIQSLMQLKGELLDLSIIVVVQVVRQNHQS